MASIIDSLSLPHHLEDISMCHHAYGTGINYNDCATLASQLPRSLIPVPFNTQGQGEFGLPYQKNVG